MEDSMHHKVKIENTFTVYKVPVKEGTNGRGEKTLRCRVSIPQTILENNDIEEGDSIIIGLVKRIPKKKSLILDKEEKKSG